MVVTYAATSRKAMFRLDSSTVAQLVPPRGKTTQVHRLVCSTVSANHRVVVLWLISSIINTPKRVYKRETNNPRNIIRYVLWQDYDEKQNSYIYCSIRNEQFPSIRNDLPQLLSHPAGEEERTGCYFVVI